MMSSPEGARAACFAMASSRSSCWFRAGAMAVAVAAACASLAPRRASAQSAALVMGVAARPCDARRSHSAPASAASAVAPSRTCDLSPGQPTDQLRALLVIGGLLGIGGVGWAASRPSDTSNPLGR